LRKLILLRHAKSDYPEGVRDHERPLAERGRRDAPVAGGWIADHIGAVDDVLVSSAVRAQQTWELASSRVHVTGVVSTEPSIYEAPASTLLDIVRALPDSSETVIMVGHNPGLEELAADLATDGDPDALGRMAMKYPTSGIAVIEGEGDWADLLRGARLVAFVIPRG